MRVFHHHALKALFLAVEVVEVATGQAYRGYVLEAQGLGPSDGLAKIRDGRLKHTCVAMPEDLSELSSEDQVPTLPGVLAAGDRVPEGSAASVVGSPVEDVAGAGKDEELKLLDSAS